MRIAGIIVASGQSKRFERCNKLLADFHGKPVIAHVANAARMSTLAETVLVTSANSRDAVKTACGVGLRTVDNPATASGLSSSIQTGLSALVDDFDGAMILLGDMPLVTFRLIDRLIDAFASAHGDRIVFPQDTNGRQGNPVLWPRALFADLMAVRGDQGGKIVLAYRNYLHLPVTVAGADADAAFCDVDTQADLQRLRARKPS